MKCDYNLATGGKRGISVYRYNSSSTFQEDVTNQHESLVVDMEKANLYHWVLSDDILDDMIIFLSHRL